MDCSGISKWILYLLFLSIFHIQCRSREQTTTSSYLGPPPDNDGVSFCSDTNEEYYGVSKTVLPNLTTVSACAWVKLQQRMSNEWEPYVFSYAASEFRGRLPLGLSIKTVNRSSLWDGIGSFYNLEYAFSLRPGGLPYDNTWHSVCWSVEVSPLNMSMYVDGTQLLPRNLTYDFTLISGQRLIIGQRLSMSGTPPFLRTHFTRSDQYQFYGTIGSLNIWSTPTNTSNLPDRMQWSATGDVYHMTPEDIQVYKNGMLVPNFQYNSSCSPEKITTTAPSWSPSTRGDVSVRPTGSGGDVSVRPTGSGGENTEEFPAEEDGIPVYVFVVVALVVAILAVLGIFLFRWFWVGKRNRGSSDNEMPCIKGSSTASQSQQLQTRCGDQSRYEEINPYQDKDTSPAVNEAKRNENTTRDSLKDSTADKAHMYDYMDADYRKDIDTVIIETSPQASTRDSFDTGDSAGNVYSVPRETISKPSQTPSRPPFDESHVYTSLIPKSARPSTGPTFEENELYASN